MAKTSFTSVNEYLGSKPKDVQLILRRVRQAILKAAPEVEEGIADQIPVYRLHGLPILFMAGWKAHYSLYPVGEAVTEAFKDELAGYERTKSTLRFPLSQPVPMDLIARIAKFRARQITKPEKSKGSRKTARESQLERLRRICNALPSASEKLSHGAPTFFVEKDKGVFVMFADNHHEDGSVAVWLPAPDGLQAALIEEAPETYFKPPYVGSSGWIGIQLQRINDHALEVHVRKAWDMTVRNKKPR